MLVEENPELILDGPGPVAMVDPSKAHLWGR